MDIYENEHGMNRRDTMELPEIIQEEEAYDERYGEKREKRTKKRNRKLKRKKRLLPTILILIMLIVAGVIFVNSSYFNMDKISVKGNEYYTDEQIIEISKMKMKTNLFKIGKSDVEKRLIADPYIRDAEVTRKLPSTVVISVKERKEVAAVKFNKQYYIIDESGCVLAVADKKPKITRIIKLTVEEGTIGEALKVKENSMYSRTLEMLKKAADSTLRFRYISVRENYIKAYVYKNLYVRGVPEDIEECIKSGKLEAVLYDLTEKGIKSGMVRIGEEQYCVYSPEN